MLDEATYILYPGFDELSRDVGEFRLNWVNNDFDILSVLPAFSLCMWISSIDSPITFHPKKLKRS